MNNKTALATEIASLREYAASLSWDDVCEKLSVKYEIEKLELELATM
jgi:hypothetical protein